MSRPLPTPFQEKKGTWAFRIQRNHEREYFGGYKNKTEATRALATMVTDHAQNDRPAGQGPHKTPLAVALSDYALQCLPFKKGARQEANRINRYLRACNLPILKLEPIDSESGSVKATMRGESKQQSTYFRVFLQPEEERIIKKSLRAHRAKLAAESPQTSGLRAQLARTMMADVSSSMVQALVSTMGAEDYSASTIHLEIALLRVCFEHARINWKWPRPQVNPAKGIDLPLVDNQREQILTEDDWKKVSGLLRTYDNPYVLPLVSIMLETAMRSCEPLTKLRWRNIDWDRRVIKLENSKTGARSVPLGPGALLILRTMSECLQPVQPDGLVFPLTYEAFKKAWSTACKKAGVANIKPHDLRHTSATRWALVFNGNLSHLQNITGHKTISMLMR